MLKETGWLGKEILHFAWGVDKMVSVWFPFTYQANGVHQLRTSQIGSALLACGDCQMLTGQTGKHAS